MTRILGALENLHGELAWRARHGNRFYAAFAKLLSVPVALLRGAFQYPNLFPGEEK